MKRLIPKYLLLPKIKLDYCFLTFYIILIVYLINIKHRGSILFTKDFFLNPQDPMQRRYEALRALFVEEHGFGGSSPALRLFPTYPAGFKHQAQQKNLTPFFLPLKQGPKAPRPDTLQLKDRIVSLRKRNYSIDEIRESLSRDGEEISNKTIYLLLEEEGFTKLFRRTRAERREALQAGREPTEVADVEAFGDHPRSPPIMGVSSSSCP